jgi:hypothetical protein
VMRVEMKKVAIFTSGRNAKHILQWGLIRRPSWQ